MDREGNALMIARGFKSVIWVATVGGAALGCYMVSLRVATERNELAKVERQIVAAKRDIRSLQTELGTRGRMTQLEQWNAEVLALSAPSSQQFLKDEFTLARLYRNDPTVADRSAELRLASAETPAARPAEPAKPAEPAVVQAVAERPAASAPLIHRASFTPGEPADRPAPAKPERTKPLAPAAKPVAERSAAATTARPDTAASRPAAKPAKPQPASLRVAAGAGKAEPAAARSAAKPIAKPVNAAAKPVREAAATERQAKAKGSGGN
jgi:hypothetical protein